MKIKYFKLVKFIYLLLVTSSVQAFAQSSDQAVTLLLKDVLDSQQAVATTEGSELGQACSRLSQLSSQLSGFAGYSQAAEFSKNLINKRCFSTLSFELDASHKIDLDKMDGAQLPGTTKDLTPMDSTAHTPVYATWDEPPLCPANSRYNHLCYFNKKTGRGLFIFEEPEIQAFSNYLVCASKAGEHSGFFGSGYAITSRCLISSLDWRVYTHIDKDTRIRNDVRGFLNWTESNAFEKPIALPVALAEQCREAFKGAIYCSPQLIVLPTQVSKAFDVCELETYRSAVSILFISIKSGSSHWKCQRFDLAKDPVNEILSVEEESCLPNYAAEVDPGCDLPYIPRTEYPIREKWDD